MSGIPHILAGVLLYAKTYEEIVPDNTYRMDENEILVKKLDLNQNFEDIKRNLDRIIFDFFEI